MKRFAALLGVLLLSPLHLGAQEPAQQAESLRSGSRVRISAPSVSSRPLSGTVFFAEGDTLFLDRKHRPGAVIPMSAVESIEISRGRDHWRGALQGAGIGAAVGGVAFGVAAVSSGGWSCDYCLYGNSLVTGFIIGAVYVGVPSGLIGGLVGAERWERIAPPVKLRLTPEPGGGGSVGVSFSIR